ncbi:MAG TPA: carboxypeptidase regulatory-like domain-containing protein [Vicinamibacterales bacterium]|nr:carboxypeptidase regulatory-like domain-containing protein [Vicinamibacterales bacterium]
MGVARRIVSSAIVATLVGLSVSACGGNAPAAPSPPQPPAPPSATRYSLSGRVLSGSGGTGIGSARVDVSAGVNVGKTATADAEGRYTINDLVAGEMTLLASAPGYTTQSSKVTIGANQTFDFNLPAAPPTADRATVSGVVSFGPSKVCLGASRVDVTAGPDSGRSANVDDTGRYALPNLRLGSVTLEASAPGHAAQTTTLTLTADQAADFTLAASPNLTIGRAIDAVTQNGVGSLKVDGDGVSGTSCDASGAFLVSAAAGSADPRLLIFTGPDLVERRTNVRLPGADLLVSLISGGFDLRAFDEMFRAPQLRRWTSAPPLLIEARSLQFTDVNMMDAVALDDVMPDAEAASLVSDLTWALPQLTGGSFSNFSNVSRQTAAQGARVNLLNDDVITVSRVVGLTAATGFWGYGRWRFQNDGRVVAGIVMLDRDFDRSGSGFVRSLRAHELGHALGYNHVTARTSVMNAQARTEPNDFDHDAARIAFQRPPGNRSPDVDPSSASINRVITATWSAPIR